MQCHLTNPADGRSASISRPGPDGNARAGRLGVAWARHLDEVRAAQRLRHAVFAGEMGARLPVVMAGHDIDRFDDFCEHLLVRDETTGTVVGTYRLLTPTQARRAGGTYTDTEFDLARIDPLRGRLCELGRSCVHPQYRSGAVILALWTALADFMSGAALDTMIGCASIPMLVNGAVSSEAAVSVWRQIQPGQMAPADCRVQPRLPLPVDRLDDMLVVAPPPLVRGYLKLGAKVLGPPAWDPEFNSADLPMMMRIDALPNRFRESHKTVMGVTV